MQEVQTESYVRSLIELMPAAVYACEVPSGVITYYNAKAVELWGRAPRLGDTEERYCGSLRLWRPDGSLLPHAETPMALALADGRPARNQEVVIERPDGTRVPVLVNIDPICDTTGKIVGAINVFHDATLARQADEARAWLASIVRSSDDAIISKDSNGIITSWNLGAERLFGYTAEEAIGQPVTLLIPPERHDEEPGILGRVRRGERVDHYETARRRKDGSLVDISLTVSPVRNSRGDIVGASKIARDITGQKQAATLAALNQEVMARLYEIGKRCVRPGDHFIENLGEMLEAAIRITVADKGHVQLYDERAGMLVLVSQRGFDDATLAPLSAVAPDQGTASGAACVSRERVVVADVATSAEFAGHPARQALLSAKVVGAQSTPLTSSTGAVLGVMSTYFVQPTMLSPRQFRLLDVLARQAADYIERKRNDEQRDDLLRIAETARQQAEEANRAKDEFLAMLGHELRNPLAAVRNAVAAATLDKAHQGRALVIAQRQTDQLARIVDDLLDVARTTRGRVPLRRARVPLADILQRAGEGARPLMEERGHLLALSMPANHLEVDADAARIEQAIANVLANAAKYTDPGGTIEVSATREGADAVIRIRDDGIGISADMLPRVFDLFTQGERTLERAQGGLGIGLTLVRRIMELHGGSAEAASEGPGRGSEFTLRLPAPAAADGSQVPVPTKASPGSHRNATPKRVLMVEDNPDAAETLMMILELLGHHVRVAHDGPAAIAQARANRPDLMLVDIGLPGMDGYEVARIIRGDASLGTIVLVALTGYGSPDDKARAMAAGFDYHLVKPVDLGALGDLVGRLGTRSGEGVRH